MLLTFRKKPVEILAIKWTGDNLRAIIDFTGLNESALKWTWEEYEDVVKKDGLKIFTLEGPLMASIGDWIIQGLKGEFYPCKPDIFEKTYDAIMPTEHKINELKARAKQQHLTNGNPATPASAGSDPKPDGLRVA